MRNAYTRVEAERLNIGTWDILWPFPLPLPSGPMRLEVALFAKAVAEDPQAK